MYVLQEHQEESDYDNPETEAIAVSESMEQLQAFATGVTWNEPEWDGYELFIVTSSKKLLNNPYRPPETTISYSIIPVPYINNLIKE